MCTSPNKVIVANQTSITGPNRRATFAVPRDWIRNNPTRITKEAKVIALGLARLSKLGTSCRPWNAPRTDMAGVMIESP